MKTDLFHSCGHCWLFQICWHIECSTFIASSFRIWNSSAGIPSPPLALFIVMLPKGHLTSHSRLSGSRWVITPLWLSGSSRPFLYSSSVYSHHLCLISSTSVMSILFIYCAHLCMKFSLDISNFLEEISSLSHSMFSSIYLHHSFKKAFLSLLAILWTSAFRWVNLSLSPLPFASLLFSAICKASSDNHFVFLHLFFFGVALVTTPCTMLQTSVHSSSGTLSTRSNPLSLFVSSTV